MKLGTRESTAIMTIATALGITGCPGLLTARSNSAPVMELAELQPIQLMIWSVVKIKAGKCRENENRERVSCLNPSLGPKADRYATGVVDRRLKKMIASTAGRKVRPYTDAPMVPTEIDPRVQFADNQNHMQSIMKVCARSLGLTRSMPLDSTPNPSNLPTSFHS
jgi:hypothetical protein